MGQYLPMKLHVPHTIMVGGLFGPCKGVVPWTDMPMQHIIILLEFCIKNTYFLFQGVYYEQVHGTAVGSLISPLIGNLFMEEFEVNALSSVPRLISKLGQQPLHHSKNSVSTL